MLRFRTFLTPSIPEGLFQLVAEYVAHELKIETCLEVENAHSGPSRDGGEPFTSDEVDVAFLCSPPYIWLTGQVPPPIELLPVAPVHDDTRNGGKAVYFSDVIVRADSGVHQFLDLRGASWSYNDPESLSGYYCTVQKLESMSETAAFFGRIVDGGSHLGSIRMVLDGEITASAIDSIALALYRRRHPHEAETLRVIESWGPSPVQPIVTRRSLAPGLKQELAAALDEMHAAASYDERLAEYEITHFGRVSDSDYDVERQLLARCAGLDLAL